jgi:hypothetical protein
MEILDAAGPMFQIGTFFLFFSSCVHNILLLHVFMMAGFLGLTVFAATGLPTWPAGSNSPKFSMDMFLWSLANMLLQFALIVHIARQYQAEYSRKFRHSKDEQLWRGLHRQTGMSDVNFKHLLNLGHWEVYHTGTTIQSGVDVPDFFNIILTGLVEGTAYGKPNAPRHRFAALDAFDYSVAEEFGLQLSDDVLHVQALQDTVLFRIPIDCFHELTSSNATIADNLKHLILIGLATSIHRQNGAPITSVEINQHPDTRPFDASEHYDLSLWQFLWRGMSV